MSQPNNIAPTNARTDLDTDEAEPNRSAPTATGHTLFWFWVLMVGSAVVFAILRGPNDPHFWLTWEIGAMFISFLYTIVFYIRLGTRKDSSGVRIYEGIGANILVVPFLCFGAVVSLGVATAITWGTSYERWTPLTDFLTPLCSTCDKHILPLVFLVLSGAFFCAIDVMFWLTHGSPEVKHEFKQGFWFNGLPVTLAFILLLVFVCRFDGDIAWRDLLKSFIGGAVAFEMLLANTMFAILFWKPREL